MTLHDFAWFGVGWVAACLIFVLYSIFVPCRCKLCRQQHVGVAERDVQTPAQHQANLEAWGAKP